MGCKCNECIHAKNAGTQGMVICDNWESENYGCEMYTTEYDGCDCGEKDFFAQLEEE